jgi:hypothetical protein
MFANVLGIGSGPVNINSRVASGPTQLSQLLHQRRNPSLRHRTILVLRHKHADPPHPLALLRACRERPRGRCAAAHERGPKNFRRPMWLAMRPLRLGVIHAMEG